MDEVELLQLDGLYYARWKNLENAFYQYRAGTLEPAEWEAYQRIIQSRAGPGTHSAYLDDQGWRFSQDFIGYVQEVSP